MPEPKEFLLPILEILGVFICVHKLWPKGVVYGEPDDWEVAKSKAKGKAKSAKAKVTGHGGSSRGGSSDARRRRDDYGEYDGRSHSRKRDGERRHGERREIESRRYSGSGSGGGNGRRRDSRWVTREYYEGNGGRYADAGYR